jgi:predicted ATPase
MVAQFSVENFRSFKDKQVFSLLATSKTGEEHEDSAFVLKESSKERFLKTSVIYGANASGKSNFFEALRFFREFAIFSASQKQSVDEIEVQPFLFSTQTERQPSSFELIFWIESVRYRYALSVTKEKIVSEELAFMPTSREIKLFSRNKQKITTHKDHLKGIGENDLLRVRENCSALSVFDQLNETHSKTVCASLRQLVITSGLENLLDPKDEEFDEEKILSFLHFADIQVQAIQRNAGKLFPLSLLSIPPSYSFAHHVFDKNKKAIGKSFLKKQEESKGTQKLFSYALPFLKALEKGDSLFIDEFDSQLHPLIIENLI